MTENREYIDKRELTDVLQAMVDSGTLYGVVAATVKSIIRQIECMKTMVIPMGDNDIKEVDGYISKAEVVERLRICRNVCRKELLPECASVLKFAIALVGNIPAADVSPRGTKTWVKIKHGYVCPACENETDTWEAEHASYCPHCGVRIKTEA